MGAVFLVWFLPPVVVRCAALLASAELFGILILNPSGVNDITFRDVGLLGAALALVLILRERTSPSQLESVRG